MNDLHDEISLALLDLGLAVGIAVVIVVPLWLMT